MLIKKTIFVLSLLLFAVTSLSQAGQDDMVSGNIITGYRVLQVDPAGKEINLTVYRGDYIKFRYPDTFAALDFAIPELKYKDTIFANPEKSPFFKMKTTGTYSFNLGKASGKITVIELSRPNYQAVTADEAAKLLENLHPFILDVRTPQEYKQIHIEGTHLIPIQQLQSRISELESKKHEDVFIYCATGNRSTVASRILADMGFKRIYNLRYGIYDWARNGHPYVTGE
jgi:rhodanese-related sulfurtransferase